MRGLMPIVDAYKKKLSELLYGTEEGEMEWYMAFVASRTIMSGVEVYTRFGPIDGCYADGDIAEILAYVESRNPCKPHETIRVERCLNKQQRKAAKAAHQRRNNSIMWFAREMSAMEAKFI